LQIIADTAPERVYNGKKQALQWAKSAGCGDGEQKEVGPLEEACPKSETSKKRKVIDLSDDGIDPYNLPPAVLAEKIAEQKQIEEDAKNRRDLGIYALPLQENTQTQADTVVANGK